MMQVGRGIVYVLYLLSDDGNLAIQKEAASSSRDSGLSMTEKKNGTPPGTRFIFGGREERLTADESWLVHKAPELLRFVHISL